MPTTIIDRFCDEFAFLSNFHPSYVEFEGMWFPTVEHAFQAAKTLDKAEREMIAVSPTPGKAKRAGRKVTMRAGWDAMRVDVMEQLLRKKFSDPNLRELLSLTRGFDLVEDNNWNDTFWGVCNGVGQNILGKLLMKIRDE